MIEAFGLLDLPLIGSVCVNNLVLAHLKTRFDWRQVIGVDALVHHEQVACEFIERNAQVPASFSDVLEGLRSSKRLPALNWDLLLQLSIDINADFSNFDYTMATPIYESDVCVMGVFVDDAER